MMDLARTPHRPDIRSESTPPLHGEASNRTHWLRTLGPAGPALDSDRLLI